MLWWGVHCTDIVYTICPRHSIIVVYTASEILNRCSIYKIFPRQSTSVVYTTSEILKRCSIYKIFPAIVICRRYDK